MAPDMIFSDPVRLPARSPRGADSREGGVPVESVTGLLETAPPFSVLHPDDLTALASRMRFRSYRAGEAIFRQGDAARSLYVIHQGRVKLFNSSSTDQERLIAVLGPGQVFGELEVLSGDARVMGARAVDHVVVFAMDRHLLRAVLKTRSAFTRRLLELVARRLRRADQATQDLIFFDAGTRLARRLVELADDHGRPVEDGAIVIDLPITQKEVAQMIGVNRASVNRLIRSLVERGLIEWNQGRPLVLQPDVLRSLARS
jgi:CRP/FNR family transcriptional regulator, cyclic AMP receptor protein